VITHLVFLRYHDHADAPEGARRLRALQAQIPSLRSLEVLEDVLRRDGAFDLALRTTFDDVAGLDAYQVHPAHQEFLAWQAPKLAVRAVVDAQND
jgi:hypothetical protein